LNISNKRKTDHYKTPSRVFDYIKLSRGIDLRKMFDPCPYHSKFDGLQIKFKKKNYINPPYDLLKQFTKKAFFQWLNFGFESYILLPLKTDQTWFHNYILDFEFEIVYFPFRIQFNGTAPALQNHCLVIMK